MQTAQIITLGTINMKSKRINHQVNTFCDMFLGWRLFCNDFDTLIKIQKGDLYLNILEKLIFLDGKPFKEDLNIVHEISEWFERDIKRNNIDRGCIKKAELIVKFRISPIQQDNYYPIDEKKINKLRNYRIDFELISTIKTDEKEYWTNKSSYLKRYSKANI